MVVPLFGSVFSGVYIYTSDIYVVGTRIAARNPNNYVTYFKMYGILAEVS